MAKIKIINLKSKKSTNQQMNFFNKRKLISLFIVIVIFYSLFKISSLINFNLYSLSSLSFHFSKLKYKSLEAIQIQNTPELLKTLDHYISFWNKFLGINGVLLISKGNKVKFKNVYNHPLTPKKHILNENSIFKIGSISKQFISASILYLEKLHKLNTEDRICQYIEDCSEDKEEVKIIHLLNHTSGLNQNDIRYFLNNLFYSYYSPIYFIFFGVEKIQNSIDRRTRLILQTPLIQNPGTKFSYSNPGYNLLAKIIENVSGNLYIDFLKENIFFNFQLESTGSLFDPNPSIKPVSDVTIKGIPPLHKRFVVSAWDTYWNMLRFYMHGAGDIYSTVFNLSKWNHILYQENQLIDQEQLKKMTQPYMNQYGLGIMINSTERSKSKVYWHNGQIVNTFAINFYFPKEELSVIFLTNSFSGSYDAEAFQKNLVRLLLEKEYKIPH